MFAINTSDSEFDRSNLAADYRAKVLSDESNERAVMGRVQRSQREREICSKEKEMERRARTMIEKHFLFVGRAQQFEFQYRDEVLVVRGSVPSFYLKQVLQSVLKNLDGVRRIDNQVTVDWSDGLIGPNRN